MFFLLITYAFQATFFINMASAIRIIGLYIWIKIHKHTYIDTNGVAVYLSFSNSFSWFICWWDRFFNECHVDNQILHWQMFCPEPHYVLVILLFLLLYFKRDTFNNRYQLFVTFSFSNLTFVVDDIELCYTFLVFAVSFGDVDIN